MKIKTIITVKRFNGEIKYFYPDDFQIEHGRIGFMLENRYYTFPQSNVETEQMTIEEEI